MGTRAASIATLWVCLLAAAPSYGEPDAKSERQAVALLVQGTTAARTAKRGDSTAAKALADALEAASDFAGPLLKSTADGGRVGKDRMDLGTSWNAAVTLLRYHGGRPTRDYILSPLHSFREGGIRIGLPVSARWSYEYTGKNEQHLLSITQTSAAGAPICLIRLHFYRWDTVYSGVGGENYVGLAKVMHELDRDATLGKGRKVSPRVTAVRLNDHFPRAQYYYVEGFDLDKALNVRLRNYYVKDRSRTYCVEVCEFLDAAPKDDAVDAWQRDGDACPERRALLASIAPRE